MSDRVAGYLNLQNCHEKKQTMHKAKLPFCFCQNAGGSLTRFWIGSYGMMAWQQRVESHVGQQGTFSLYRDHQLCGLPGAISNAFLISNSHSKDDSSSFLFWSASQGLQCLCTYTRSCISWAMVQLCIISMYFSWLSATLAWVCYPVDWHELQ